VSQEECTRLRENVPYVKVHRYNPKHLYPKLNGYGDNGQRSLKVTAVTHLLSLAQSSWDTLYICNLESEISSTEGQGDVWISLTLRLPD